MEKIQMNDKEINHGDIKIICGMCGYIIHQTWRSEGQVIIDVCEDCRQTNIRAGGE